MKTTTTTTTARKLTAASRRKVWRNLRLKAHNLAIDAQYCAMQEINCCPDDQERRAEWRAESDQFYQKSDETYAIADAMCPKKRIG
jgi:hypothetical protein